MSGRGKCQGALGALLLISAVGCSTSTGGTGVDNADGSAPAVSPSVAASRSTPAPTPSIITSKASGETQFSTPSRNIGCYFAADAVRCDVLDRTWKAPPPRPGECDFGDWGNGLSLESERPMFTCATDTVAGSDQLLAYGHALEIGDFRCTSLRTGLTCDNKATGHGFTLSRTAYELR